MTVQLIDISNNNGTVNWRSLPSTVRGVYAKASQGVAFTDKFYAANATGALTTGRHIGAYHYADRTGSAVAQAQHFANVIGRPGAGHLDPVLDLEGEVLDEFVRRGDRAGAVAWVRAFTTTVDKLTGRRCGIYVSDSTVDFLGSAWASLTAGRFIWLARIGHAPAHPCHMWQNSWYGRLAGIAGDVDLDQFNGTAAELATWAHMPAPVPAHVTTGRLLRLTHPFMHGADVVAVQKALIRHGQHIAADGYFGPATSAAVLAFKRTVKWLPHNAIVGAGTRRALGI